MARSRPEHRPDGDGTLASEAISAVREAGGDVKDAVEEAAQAVKPRLRGWIHAGLAPLALVFGIVLIVLTPSGAPRLSVAMFAVATVLLFGTSAVYHRGNWSVRTAAVLRRLDHSNIFLVIAGTYTPLATMLLPASTARTLLITVWTGAIAGILMRVLWLGAPRWLYVPIYVALGWVAVWFLPAFGRSGGPAVMWLVIGGGLAYTIGALVYAMKRPNPSPRWFGFHEIFHVGTMLGYVSHGIAIAIAALSLR